MIRNVGILFLIAAECLHAAQSGVITRAADSDAVYQAILNQLKKDGVEIESASKDAGIKTGVRITGHYKQTGSYMEITFIADGPSQTAVKVTAYEEKRYKGLKTEQWFLFFVFEEQLVVVFVLFL